MEAYSVACLVPVERRISLRQQGEDEGEGEGEGEGCMSNSDIRFLATFLYESKIEFLGE